MSDPRSNMGRILNTDEESADEDIPAPLLDLSPTLDFSQRVTLPPSPSPLEDRCPKGGRVERGADTIF